MKKESLGLFLARLIITESLLVAGGSLIGILAYSSVYPDFLSNQTIIPILSQKKLSNIEISSDTKSVLNALTKEIIFNIDDTQKYLKDSGYFYQSKTNPPRADNSDTFQTTNAKYGGDCFLDAALSSNKDGIVFSTGCLPGDLPQAWVGIYRYPPESYFEAIRKGGKPLYFERFKFIIGGSGRNFVWSSDDKTITYEADLGLSGMTETRTIDSATGEILNKKMEVRIGRGEIDDGIDVVRLQTEIDNGDQSWKLRYGCMGCTEEEVRRASPIPVRVEPDMVLKENGKLFGFVEEDLVNFNLEKPFNGQGQKIYKIYHKNDLYLVTLKQPIVGYYKIWIISEIEIYRKKCNPKLIGIEIENKVNLIFKENKGKLEQIISPEQFKESGYNEYCVIWRNITNLSNDIINELPENDLFEQQEDAKKNNLYKNDNFGFQFYYPKEWSYGEYRDGNYILFTPSLSLEIDFLIRSGKWAMKNMHSVIIDGQKTFILESGNEWDEKKGEIITGKSIGYLSKITTKGHDVYIEYTFSYNPQSIDSVEIIKKNKEIFEGILSTFKFTE